MFGKIECKLCSDKVRFAFRHLKIKHPDVLEDEDIKKLNMAKITIKYFKQIEGPAKELNAKYLLFHIVVFLIRTTS